MTGNPAQLAGSFRDPSGFVFTHDAKVFRQINSVYKEDYERLMGSGLYESLLMDSLIVKHDEADIPAPAPEIAFKVIRPELIPFISYPYEWCFSQLKDAALATLEVHLRAIEYGMALKDASAYNIQFQDGRPMLMDTLSFEAYREGEPWVAYRQFCQHFLSPLSLMSRSDIRLGQLSRVFVDGVPLDLASKLLPFASKIDPSLLMHVHMHAKSQKRYSDTRCELKKKNRHSTFSSNAMRGLIESLKSAVMNLRWEPRGTEWGEYYSHTNYSNAAMKRKAELVETFLSNCTPESVWDLGANTGVFSRLASERGVPTVAFDIDPAAVEKNYRECRDRGRRNLLPLLLDLTNPSPAIGWENNERASLAERGPAGMVFALALIHHLAISNNLPLDRIGRFLRDICKKLVIEFVPKTDIQVQRLLSSRRDIFDGYTEEGFERAFGIFFEIEMKRRIEGTERTLYFMKSR